MATIIFVLVFVITIGFMLNRKATVPAGQVISDPLTSLEKHVTYVVCILNPVVAGAVLYYGWKSKLPAKARQANRIAWSVVVCEILIGVALPFALELFVRLVP